MTRRKSAQRDIMQTYIENEQKEFVPLEPQLVPVEKYNRKICIIKPETKHESVHIPVILSESGLKETVYNDFYIGDALNQILDYLESRYDIDFDNMEMQYQYSNDDED